MDDASNRPSVLARVELYPIRLPYRRAIKWASVQEDGADYLIMKLTTQDGLIGVSEGTVKPTWTGSTLRSLAVSIEELFVPRMKGADLSDPPAVRKLVGRLPGHDLAKSMIDFACWDILSQKMGKPLWQMWGGVPTVDVSCSVTRQDEDKMAEEASRMAATHGVTALKLKGGQGIEPDVANVRAIRRAAGDRVTLYVDTNRAYSAEEVPDYSARLADLGVIMIEDPCPLEPTETFTHLQDNSALPIIVDSGCSNILMARLYLARGAKSIVLKPGKAGLTDAREIARLAAEADCEVHVSVLGGSSLGALISLQLASAIAGRNNILPAEATFFLQLATEYVQQPLTIVRGQIALPQEPGFDRFVDWQRVQSLRPN